MTTEPEAQQQTATVEDQIETKALALRHNYESLVITDQASFESMGSYEDSGRDGEKMIDEHFTPMISEAHAHHKKLVAAKKKLKDIYTALKEGARRQRLDYAAEQREKAEAETRKAQEAAQKAAEDERVELAASYEAQGHKGAAEAALSAPVPQQAVAPVTPVPKVKGARKVWSYKVVNFGAFVQGCVEKKGPLSLACLDENNVVLGQLVRALKVNFVAPGVRVEFEER